MEYISCDLGAFAASRWAQSSLYLADDAHGAPIMLNAESRVDARN
jgi:hypothetical protein